VRFPSIYPWDVYGDPRITGWSSARILLPFLQFIGIFRMSKVGASFERATGRRSSLLKNSRRSSLLKNSRRFPLLNAQNLIYKCLFYAKKYVIVRLKSDLRKRGRNMKNSRAAIQNRQNEIIKLLQKSGKMPVELIAEQLNVTPTTIRRDLIQLEAAGTVRRG